MKKTGKRRPDHRGMKRKKRELKRRGKRVPAVKAGPAGPRPPWLEVFMESQSKKKIEPGRSMVPTRMIRRSQSR